MQFDHEDRNAINISSIKHIHEYKIKKKKNSNKKKLATIYYYFSKKDIHTLIVHGTQKY